ncbi:MAG: AsmA-like C-terminal region-containing protein [Candidatus Eisenbacteria bacterium]
MFDARLNRLPSWVWFLGAPVALVLAAWLALSLLFPPARVKQLVNAHLQRALRREVRFEDASLKLWLPVRLSVQGPELAEPRGFADGVAFRAASLEMDLEVLPLLSRRLVVHRLVIEKPALHLALRADGTSNFDNFATPDRPGGAPAAVDLNVREFEVHGGQILIDDLAASRRVALELSTRMALATEHSAERVVTSGETVIENVVFGPGSANRASDLDQGLKALVWRIEHKGRFDSKRRRLALEKLALKLGRTDLALSGIIDEPGPRARYDLRAKGDRIDLAEVLRWMAVADAKAVQGITGRGQLAFDVSLRGAAAKPGSAASPPSIVGVLSVRDGAVRYPGAPAEVKALSLTARFRPDSVAIRDLACVVSGQPIRAQLFATRLVDPLVRFAIQGNVDLAAIAPLVAPRGAKLSGHAAVDVRGSGRAKDPGSLTLDGTAVLRNVGIESKDLPKRIEKIGGTVRFSAARAEVRGLTAHAGPSSYTLDAMITRPLALMAEAGKVAPAGVTFDLRSPYLDLADLLPITPGAPFLPNASGRGQVHLDRLLQRKLDVRSVAAEVVLSPTRLSSPRFSMLGYGGAVKGDASFDLTDTRKPAYAVHAIIERVQADALLTTWTPVRGLVRGALDSNFNFAGRGQQPEDLRRTLTLVGLAVFSEGTLGPGPSLDAISQFVRIPALKQVKFKKMNLPVRIEQGRVFSDRVQLAGSYGEWAMAGSLGFDGALDYAVSITLPPAAVEALHARSALAAGALTDDQGRMLLDLRLYGNAKNPKVGWDTRAMRDRLAGRASTALAEQRAKLEADLRAAAQQALTQQLGLGAADSTKRSPNLHDLGAAARDSIKKAAGGLLEGFFKKPKPGAPATPPPATPPPATPPPATPPTVPPDTTNH